MYIDIPVYSKIFRAEQNIDRGLTGVGNLTYRNFSFLSTIEGAPFIHFEVGEHMHG